MSRLCVLGALHWDVIVQAPHLPRRDETVTGTGVSYQLGGKGGNQAMMADRLGTKVSFLGRVGQDAFGDELRRALSAGSLDLSQLQSDAGSSGMSVAIEEQSTDYGAVIVSEANLRMNSEAFFIPKDCGTLLLQNEVPAQANLALAQKAKAEGAEVWLNAAPARELEPQLLELLDVLIVNQIEAAFYGAMRDTPDVAQIRWIETRGRAGAVMHAPDGLKTVYPAYEVEALSTHGAGDAFAGALAHARLAAMPWQTAMPFALAAAALHVSSGTVERQAKSEESVMNFMQNQNK